MVLLRRQGKYPEKRTKIADKVTGPSLLPSTTFLPIEGLLLSRLD
jgi:hypothetical protein